MIAAAVQFWGRVTFDPIACFLALEVLRRLHVLDRETRSRVQKLEWAHTGEREHAEHIALEVERIAYAKRH